MSEAVDLLVVGGGPAGASLAALAAGEGLRTTVIERARFPRDKVCGEFLSAEGCRVLRRLGVLDGLLDAGAVWLGSCRVTHPRGPAIDLALPVMKHGGREALGVSRRLLDTTLLAHAARAGARVLQPWEATAPIVEGGRVRGLLARPVGAERTTEIRARLVVAADGRHSILARMLSPERARGRGAGPGSWYGLSVHLDGTPDPAPRIELHLFDGGYAGIGPVEDGSLNLGLLVRRETLRGCGGSPDVLLRRNLMANPCLRRTLGEARRRHGWKGVGPLRFGPRRPTAAGVLFVGDAAGTVDPFCGEGMSNALCGAVLAEPFALEALRRGALEHDLARAYDEAWRRAFARVGRRVRLLGALLQRPALARPVLRLLHGAARPLAPRLLAATRTDWSG